MKKKILQKIADKLMKILETSLKNDDMYAFDYFYAMALQFDYICIEVFDVYLDWKKSLNKTCKVEKLVVILHH